jgi:sugar lactone lactonase YvrE
MPQLVSSPSAQLPFVPQVLAKSGRWSIGLRTSMTGVLLLLGLAAFQLASGSGPLVHAQDIDLVYPVDVAVDAQGTLYVADRNLPGIWQIKDGRAEVFFKAENKFRTPLNAVRCVAVDAQGRVLAGCSTTTEIYRFEDGRPIPLTGGQISVPMNLTVDAQGDIIVCDLKLRQVVRVLPEQQIKVLATIQAPKAVLSLSSEQLLVLTGVDRPLLKISSSGDPQKTITEGQNVQVFGGDHSPADVLVADRPFDFPADMVALTDGTIVVSDSYSKCLWRVSSTGEVTKWVSDPRFVHPVGLATDGQQVYVADPRAKAIFRVQSDGSVELVHQSTAATAETPK